MAQILASIKRYCRQEADTASLAKSLGIHMTQYLGKHPQAHLNITLEGDLGAGKTSFARHLIQSMGYVGRVKSPTYTLCEPYPLQINGQSLMAHHFDLYRMKDPLEWQEAGFGEYFDVPGFCLVEWPEKAEGTLPSFDLQICLQSDASGDSENAREIQMHAHSTSGAEVLKDLA